jgi:hypothetical protein
MIEVTRERLSTAIEKAKQEHNFVRSVGWRRYQVNTQHAKTYFVIFDVVDGKKVAKCNCRAGTNNTPCYHVAAALSLHIAIASTKTEQEKPAERKPVTPREILVKKACEHKDCPHDRCAKGLRIGGIEI